MASKFEKRSPEKPLSEKSESKEDPDLLLSAKRSMADSVEEESVPLEPIGSVFPDAEEAVDSEVKEVPLEPTGSVNPRPDAEEVVDSNVEEVPLEPTGSVNPDSQDVVDSEVKEVPLEPTDSVHPYPDAEEVVDLEVKEVEVKPEEVKSVESLGAGEPGKSEGKGKTRAQYEGEFKEEAISPRENTSPSESTTGEQQLAEEAGGEAAKKLVETCKQVSGTIDTIIDEEDPKNVPAKAEKVEEEIEWDDLIEGGFRSPKYYRMFYNPRLSAQMYPRIAEGKVCLEGAYFRGYGIKGAVCVANLEYHKEVIVHYSHRKDWDNKRSVRAVFSEHDPHKNVDLFKFRYYTYDAESYTQFYIEYRTQNSGVHYDNNLGKNYVFERLVKTRPTPKRRSVFRVKKEDGQEQQKSRPPPPSGQSRQRSDESNSNGDQSFDNTHKKTAPMSTTYDMSHIRQAIPQLEDLRTASIIRRLVERNEAVYGPRGYLSGASDASDVAESDDDSLESDYGAARSDNGGEVIFLNGRDSASAQQLLGFDSQDWRDHDSIASTSGEEDANLSQVLFFLNSSVESNVDS